MKQVSLSGSPRENVGRNGSAELRRQNRVPGVLYGGNRQVHFSVAINDLDKIIRQPDTLQINLELNGETIPSIMQEIQWHPITDKPLHFDLLELVPGKPVKTALPVKTTGTSEGVRAGGKLIQNYRKMKIFGLPEHLPDNITIDISPLKIGDNVRVRDISYPNCELLEAEASVVIGVQVTRAAAAEEKAAAAAAPAAAAAAGGDAKKK
ncbi:MAG TPA: 50S ribosomal protein L25 [Cytophagales bacterium]|nr:50S ribosomal protein L25 [Cytophagales bacterium]